MTGGRGGRTDGRSGEHDALLLARFPKAASFPIGSEQKKRMLELLATNYVEFKAVMT